MLSSAASPASQDRDQDQFVSLQEGSARDSATPQAPVKPHSGCGSKVRSWRAPRRWLRTDLPELAQGTYVESVCHHFSADTCVWSWGEWSQGGRRSHRELSPPTAEDSQELGVSELLLKQDPEPSPAPGPAHFFTLRGQLALPDKDHPHKQLSCSPGALLCKPENASNGPHSTWLQHKPLPSSFQRHCPLRTTFPNLAPSPLSGNTVFQVIRQSSLLFPAS